MPKLLSIFYSVLAAMFGVQSRAKHTLDFSDPTRFGAFLLLAILFVTLLVFALVGLVDFILR